MSKWAAKAVVLGVTASLGAIAFASENHVFLEPEEVEAQSSEPVEDVLITCVQDQPSRITHRFVIEDGQPKGYNPFTRGGDEFCFNESGACVTGWHDGDAIYLRDTSFGGRRITRIDFASMTMNVLLKQELSGTTTTSWPCTTRPLPAAR